MARERGRKVEGETAGRGASRALGMVAVLTVASMGLTGCSGDDATMPGTDDGGGDARPRLGEVATVDATPGADADVARDATMSDANVGEDAAPSDDAALPDATADAGAPDAASLDAAPEAVADAGAPRDGATSADATIPVDAAGDAAPVDATAPADAAIDAAAPLDATVPVDANTEAGAVDATVPVDGAVPADAGQDAAARDASADATIDAGTDAAAMAGLLLSATTDFSTSLVTRFDLASNTVRGRDAYNDGQVRVSVSNGAAFVTEVTNNSLDVLDAQGKPVGQPIWLAPPEAGTLTVLDAYPPINVPPRHKAYSPLHAYGTVAVVDTAAGAVAKQIDVTPFLLASAADGAPGDTDGSADPSVGVYVPSTGLVYLALQRVDQNAGNGCVGSSLLIGIDPATDAIVDLNGAAAGMGIELSLRAPVAAALDPSSGTLLLLDQGCGVSPSVKAGVESVDLATGKASAILTITDGTYPLDMQLVGDGTALVYGFDANATRAWMRWTIGTNTFGAAPAFMPEAPVVETPTTVLGLQKSAASVKQVTRVRLADGQKTVLLTDPGAPDADYGYAVGSAILR